MRITNTLIPGLVAGSLLLGTVSGSFAAGAKAHPKVAQRVVVAGQVSNLSTTSPATFTLTWTPKKAGSTPIVYQISTAATTKVAATKTTTGALQNGEYAIVIGTKSSTGIAATTIHYSATAFTAREVAILRLRLRLAELTAARAHAVRGAVVLAQTVAGSQLTVIVTTKTGPKTLTFAITPTTKFRVGKAAATTSAPSFTDGEKIAVHYKQNATTKALDAILVAVPATA